MFSTEWTRDAIAGVVNKGLGHLTQVITSPHIRFVLIFPAQSHLLWDVQRDWEMQVLEGASGPEK